MRRTISNILIIVFSAIIVISAFRLWKIFYEYHAGEKEYEETASSFVDKNEAETDNGHEESLPAECPITVDFDGLIQKNADVVGWIYSEGTQINYPVLRGEDNSVYLHNMISGEYNPSGSIFMDYRCEPDLSGFNTIIYGHHMKNGSMFASLHEYVDQSYFEDHKNMWYLTPTHVYRLDVISGYSGKAGAEVYTIFKNQDELDSYLSFASVYSDFTPDEVPEEINKVVVLSTCSYEYDDARYVVVCVPVMVK